MDTFSISCASAGCNFTALRPGQIDNFVPTLTNKGNVLSSVVEYAFRRTTSDLPEGVELNLDLICLEGCDNVFITPSTADNAPANADVLTGPDDVLKLGYTITCAAKCDKLSSEVDLPMVGDWTLDLSDLQQLAADETASDLFLGGEGGHMPTFGGGGGHMPTLGGEGGRMPTFGEGERYMPKWLRDYCRKASMLREVGKFCGISQKPFPWPPGEEED